MTANPSAAATSPVASACAASVRARGQGAVESKRAEAAWAELGAEDGDDRFAKTVERFWKRKEIHEQQARSASPDLPQRGEEGEEAARMRRHHALAYLPRPKKRSLLSSVAVSRLDLMSACLAIMALTAGRADMSSNQRLKFGSASILAPCA